MVHEYITKNIYWEKLCFVRNNGIKQNYNKNRKQKWINTSFSTWMVVNSPKLFLPHAIKDTCIDNNQREKIFWSEIN